MTTPIDHTDPLPALLTRLQLATVRDRLDALLDQAARDNLSLRDTLTFLCQAEVARKNDNRAAMNMKLARFPVLRTLDGFDFAAQPGLDPKRIAELAAARWIADADNLLLLGPPGTGKTHLAIALGREAVLRGVSVLFATAPALVADLALAHEHRRLDARLDQLAKPRLLIVDELGYLPLHRSASHLFFQLVCRRYEQGSLLITANRSVADWGEVFDDPVLATAILDRLLHHSQVIPIKGESYRLREKRRAGLLRTPIPTPT